MDPPLDLTLQMILTVMAGIGAQVLAEFLKVPGIVFLLLFGILLGPSVCGLLQPSRFDAGLEVMVALLVAIILFEGGFSLQLRDLGKVSSTLRNLVTIGAVITLLGGGMAAHWLSEFPWSIAFLYGSLVVVTGPTVISSVLKQVPVDRAVATLLEGEGVLIDPVGAILAVVVLNVLLNGSSNPLFVFADLMVRLGVGSAIGGLGGWGLGWALKRTVFLSEDLKTLVVLASLWGLFGLSNGLLSESGLMAAVAAGLVLRASAVPEERLLKRFKGQLTILAISVLFILLSADLSIPGVLALGWGGVWTVLALMFIVRPLSIWICAWKSSINWRQKLFLSWVAPRGIVSASVASLFAIVLTQRGVNGGEAIKALVFLTIVMTVFVQALTARSVAEFLQITSSQRIGAVIVGCNPLSLLIAEIFCDRSEPIALIDTDPEVPHPENQDYLRVFISSALDADVLEEAGLATSAVFLAMTNNGEVNLVVAQRAAEEFRPPKVLALFPGDPQTPTSAAIEQAFISDVTLKTWNQYLVDGAVKLGETTLDEAQFEARSSHLKRLITNGDLLPILIERDESLQILAATDEWEVGDRLIYLLHDPRPKLMKLLSGSNPARLVPEKLAEVETWPEIIEVPIPETMPPDDGPLLPPEEKTQAVEETIAPLPEDSESTAIGV